MPFDQGKITRVAGSAAAHGSHMLEFHLEVCRIILDVSLLACALRLDVVGWIVHDVICGFT